MADAGPPRNKDKDFKSTVAMVVWVHQRRFQPHRERALPAGLPERATFSPTGATAARKVTAAVLDPRFRRRLTPANFNTQYLLVAGVSPAGAGTIAPNQSSIDAYCNSGASVQLTASPPATHSPPSAAILPERLTRKTW